MKKIKILTPVLSVAALGTCVAPIATSCAQTEETTIVPTDLLNVVGYTLKGFKEDADVSKYDTLEIPDTVKFVDNDAFKDVFKTGTKNGTIKRIVFPNTIREIRDNAFDGCDSLRVLDFSTWNHDNIHRLTTGTDALANMSKLGLVVTQDGITKESKDKLQTILTSATLDDCWFAPVSSDKMSADEAWKVQKKENGRRAHYLFKCNVDLKEGTNLYAQVTKIDGTKNVDIEVHKLTNVEGNTWDLDVNLLNQEKTDDYVDFVVTFTAVKGDETTGYEPLWQEVLTDFKLTCIKADAFYVEEINLTAEAETVKPGETLKIEAEVLPEIATDKSVTWSSSDETIATVDEEGTVTGVADGSVTITATAKDGSGVKATYDLKVQDAIDFPYDKSNRDFRYTDLTNIKANVLYTFTMKGSSLPSGLTVEPATFTFENADSQNLVPIDKTSLEIAYVTNSTEKILAEITDYDFLTQGNGHYISFKDAARASCTLTSTNGAYIRIKVKYTKLDTIKTDARIRLVLDRG